MIQSELQKQEAIQLHSDQADLFADRYHHIANPYKDCFSYSRHRLQALLDHFLPATDQNLSLLDVGCGTGHHMVPLRQRGYQVSGMDASEEMLQHARKLNPESDLRKGDVEKIPFPDASFDFVLSIEVLRYLPDALPTLKEIARVLKPGGICLATAAPLLSINAYWAVNRMARFLPRTKLVTYQQSFTTSGKLRRQCQQAGFNPVEVHGVYAGPVNWVERLVRPVLPGFLRLWQPVDRVIADAPFLREFSNMFLLRATRSS